MCGGEVSLQPLRFPRSHSSRGGEVSLSFEEDSEAVEARRRVGVRTAEKNRVEKLLEDACIKLSVVASDIFGVSGRAMMEALIAGKRDPHTLARPRASRASVCGSRR